MCGPSLQILKYKCFDNFIETFKDVLFSNATNIIFKNNRMFRDGKS